MVPRKRSRASSSPQEARRIENPALLCLLPSGGPAATPLPQHQPALDIEIIHRRSLNDEAEQISINLQAMPSFEAFGRFLETTNPFALWAQTFQIACLPWLNALRSA